MGGLPLDWRFTALLAGGMALTGFVVLAAVTLLALGGWIIAALTAHQIFSPRAGLVAALSGVLILAALAGRLYPRCAR